MSNSECISTRNLLVHAHIFKNAGSTIDWILEKNFGAGFKADEEDSQMLRDPTYLRSLIFRNTGLKAISSHSMPLPVQELPGVNFYIILMLRDPILRIRSVYDFERIQKADTPGAKHAKIYDFRAYVQWRMKSDVSPTIRNMQVRYLTRRLPLSNQIIGDRHLEAAVELVKANRFVGIVERFDESMLVFRKCLLESNMKIDFSYKKQNITSKEILSRNDLIDQLREDLGSSLFEEVQEQNKYDLSLYEQATKIVGSRISELSDKEKKLANGLRI